MVKGVHPPIISEFDYWAVQHKLDGRTIIKQKKEEVYLRGVLHCNECGRLMTSGKSKGRSAYYWYYYCKTHNKNYRADTLHKKFDELLNEMTMKQEAIKVISDRIDKAINNRRKNRGGDLMRTRLQLQKIRQKIERVEEQQLLTPVSPSTYKKVMSDLVVTEHRLNEQLADQNSGVAKFEEIKNGILPYFKDLKSVFHDLDLLRQQMLINVGFSRSLSWTGEKWRTAKLHFVFADNALILKKKG
ncbi:MAG: zinc ribbon domain-containing protein [Niabella sp.]